MKDKTVSEVNGFMYVAIAVAAIGGLLFGYDTGVVSGAILFVKNQFSLSTAMEESVVSSVLVGAVLGAVLGGALTDRFGRRAMIIAAGIVFTLSAIGTALAPTVTWLIAARIASGIGIGIASFISPMYIAELVPARVRGALVAVNMLAITTGIVVADLVDYAFSGVQGWRAMFGLAAIPSVALVIGMWWHPDSPRGLHSTSRVEQARQVLSEQEPGRTSVPKSRASGKASTGIVRRAGLSVSVPRALCSSTHRMFHSICIVSNGLVMYPISNSPYTAGATDDVISEPC